MCVCAVCLVSYDTRRYDTTTTIQHNLKLMHEMYEQCIDVECACVFFLLSFFFGNRISASLFFSGQSSGHVNDLTTEEVL